MTQVARRGDRSRQTARARRRPHGAARVALARVPGPRPALHRPQHPDLRHPVGRKPPPHRGDRRPHPGRDRHRVPRRSGGARSLEACRGQDRRRAGEVRAGHAARDAEDRAGRASPSMRAIPANSVEIGGNKRRLLAGLRLALRHGSRQGPALRHDRGFPQFREAGAVLALAAPFRRHDLRAGRRAGQQAPSRHGLQPHQIFRPRLHGLGDGGKPGGRLHRHGAHRLRRGLRRPELRHPRQRQRQLAAGLGRAP